LADLQASIAASKKTVTSKNVEIGTIALEQAINTGDTAAAVAAAKAIAKAQGGGAYTQTANTISLLQSATPQPTLTAAQVARGDQIKWVGGVNGSWQVIKGTNVVSTSTTPVVTAAVTATTTAAVTAATTAATTTDPATIALIKSLQNQIASLTASNQQTAIDKAAEVAAAKKEKAESAIAVLTERFTKYNLASLVPKIKELAIGGAGESTITLQLQETDEYKQRFRANQKRIEKGLRVLAPGDYLGMEDDYRQILRAYGLKQFDNDDYVTQFISNDISDTELTNRVVTAVQRVQNADPAILNTLRSFYGISDNDLVAYVLDPNQQFQKIERQVAAAEIGAAAKLQGINAGVTVSEQLAAQGVTKAQAQKGYATIADILPTAEKLSDIYGKTLDEYRLGEAEQEVFNTLASAQRKRQKLKETEIASFSGASGLGKSSLTSQLGGTY
jgi:putative ribosome biogenesis GTPase RsgA